MSTRQLNFVPTDLSGCVLWLRADMGISRDENNLVSQWADQSGQNNHMAQASLLKRPRLGNPKSVGRPVLQFDGVDDFLQKAFTLIQPFTHFMVYQQNVFTAAGANDLAFDGATFTNAAMTCSVSTGHRWSLFAGTELNYDTQVANGAYAAICDQWNGTTSFGRVNGVQVVAGNAGTSSPNGITLGAGGNGTRACAINVAELVVYNRVMLPVEIAVTELYLMNRYQLGQT